MNATEILHAAHVRAEQKLGPALYAIAQSYLVNAQFHVEGRCPECGTLKTECEHFALYLDAQERAERVLDGAELVTL